VSTDEGVLVEIDSRGRASLARLAQNRTRFLGHVDDDGTITLVPAVVMSEMEARLRRNNPDLAARLDAPPDRSRYRPLPPRRSS
jgi:hypothetical protein